MATSIERYRGHRVWEVLQLKLEALKTNRYGSEDLETIRTDLVAAFETALQSEQNPRRAVYDDVLDRLLSTLSGINVDEPSMRQLQTYNTRVLPELYADIRRLPGPAPRNLAPTYAAAVNELIDARLEELQALRRQADELRTSLAEYAPNSTQTGYAYANSKVLGVEISKLTVWCTFNTDKYGIPAKVISSGSMMKNYVPVVTITATDSTPYIQKPESLAVAVTTWHVKVGIGWASSQQDVKQTAKWSQVGLYSNTLKK
jgi:hypothetical protein